MLFLPSGTLNQHFRCSFLFLTELLCLRPLTSAFTFLRHTFPQSIQLSHHSLVSSCKTRTADMDHSTGEIPTPSKDADPKTLQLSVIYELCNTASVVPFLAQL